MVSTRAQIGTVVLLALSLGPFALALKSGGVLNPRHAAATPQMITPVALTTSTSAPTTTTAAAATPVKTATAPVATSSSSAPTDAADAPVAVSKAEFQTAARVAAQDVPSFPAFSGGIPVLVYHALINSNDGYSVSPLVFGEQMQRLHALGFEAIGLDTFVRYVQGKKVALPRKPILLTFDDADISAWTQATRWLVRYHWTAVMYVPTGKLGSPGYMTWQQLAQMRASGHWTIEEHAGDLHVQVAVDQAGTQRPAYSNRIWANGHLESFPTYKARVVTDLNYGAAQLGHQLPGWQSHGTFAIPYSDYGQNVTNDKRIPAWFSGVLKRQFAVVFIQDGDTFAAPGPGFENRLDVGSSWSADTLQLHLLDGVTELGQQTGGGGRSGE
jgi:hypothetical protein